MEIKLLQRLRHQNIVKYIDHVLSKNSIYIVMEYMELGSLERMVKKHGIFPEELAVVYVRQILEGLYYLHEQGYASNLFQLTVQCGPSRCESCQHTDIHGRFSQTG